MNASFHEMVLLGRFFRTGGTLREAKRRMSGARWSATSAHRQRMREIETCEFVRGLRDGSLPQHVYDRFAAQDAIFLEAFARQYCELAGRAPRWSHVVALHRLAAAAIQEREQLHHGMNGARSANATLKYIDGLRRFSATEPVPLASLAALAPCMSVYAHLGQLLQADPTFQASCESGSNPYTTWVATYADPGFQSHAVEIEALLVEIEQDAARRSTSESDDDMDSRRHAVALFLDDCYSFAMSMELEFFNAAWHHHPAPPP
ncbi:Thiamine biosynthesis multifunctional protein ThiED [Porphyridium purpureum]|uniref:Thiamine biosynthesis multifunctional protein ThiED n=1 Tax=Porphyridium purpureum TaxID=35688 RepID=A0A5J4YMA6_PORPP|nr:Thiamine biosynthesis multifunctional protein ThiED [Porphyridium purpureum]|eukprot:POR5602..scf291_13